MATERFEVTNEWVKVVDATVPQFLLENEKFVNIYVNYSQSGVPDADAPGHLLKGREAMVRVGDGEIYAKSAVEGIDSSVVVTIEAPSD